MSSGLILAIMSAAILAISGVMAGVPPAPPTPAPAPMELVMAASVSGGMVFIMSAAILAISGEMVGIPGTDEGANAADDEAAGAAMDVPAAAAPDEDGNEDAAAAVEAEEVEVGANAAAWDGCRMDAAMSAMRFTSSGDMLLNDSAACLASSGVKPAPVGMPACCAIAASCSAGRMV